MTFCYAYEQLPLVFEKVTSVRKPYGGKAVTYTFFFVCLFVYLECTCCPILQIAIQPLLELTQFNRSDSMRCL